MSLKPTAVGAETNEPFFTLLYKYWHLLLDLHSWRMVFSFLRLTINAGFSFLVFFYISHFNIWVSLSSALLIGGCSAGIQFWNEYYTEWIGQGSLIAQILKWYSIEIGFLLVPYCFVFFPLGIKLGHTHWWQAGISLLGTALLSMISQGIWELAIVYRKKQKFSVPKENLNRLKVIYKFRFLIVSCFSVLCAVLNLVNLWVGLIAFILYSLSGLTYCAYLLLDHKLRKIAHLDLQNINKTSMGHM